MSDAKTQQLVHAAVGFQSIPVAKQVGLLLGLSLSIALGFYVVLWSQSPDYAPVYGKTSLRDSQAIVSALQQTGIPFKVEDGTGLILVPQGQVYEARMALAGRGVNSGGQVGLEILDKPQGFGTSQFIENARYKRGVEGELARTISTMRGIANARVHLAMPKQSVFVRDQKKPSASVMLELSQGALDQGQVAAIVNLVASSTPGMRMEDVTVVDQHGRLLSASGADTLHMASSQLALGSQIEKRLQNRILSLLEPIVGPGRVRAEVTAQMDFTRKERTQESYDPEKRAVRSERTVSEVRVGNLLAGGIPGALSNQPSEGGTAPQSPQAPGEEEAGETVTTPPSSKQSQATRNYEVNKAIEYIKEPGGVIKNLSVAVVLDDKVAIDEAGEETRTPMPEAEIAKIKTMIEKAIGLNAERGDTLEVYSQSFVKIPELPEPEAPPIWEASWFMPVVKQTLAGLFALMLIFMVLRPTLRNLSGRSQEEREMQQKILEKAEAAANGTIDDGDGNALTLRPPKNDGFDQTVMQLNRVVEDEPEKVARIVMNWIGRENG